MKRGKCYNAMEFERVSEWVGVFRVQGCIHIYTSVQERDARKQINQEINEIWYFDTRKLFVGGLSWETTQENLQRFFQRYGEVIDCVVMKNNESGRSRGQCQHCIAEWAT